MRYPALTWLCLAGLIGCGSAALASSDVAPEIIFHNGNIITVDDDFRLQKALAIQGGRILAVGSNREILRLARPGVTRVQDLQGRTVLPGLIDSHVHPAAAMTEFDHDIPDMETIQDVLDYIRSRVAALPEGQWIILNQVFITRLREQRYPTRAELDRVAPQHPVCFRTGPDAMLNTLALRLSGIDRHFTITDGGPGFWEKDAQGEPTGLLRGMTRYVKSRASGRSPGPEDTYRRTRELFQAYNRIGLTTVGDRGANAGSIERYQQMRERGELSVRLALSHTFPTIGSPEATLEAIDAIGRHPLRREDPWLRIIGTKIWLDGGMLTGSAYMRQPWGKSEIYGIDDPEYRGVLNVPPDRLYTMVERVARHGLQFTAHAVGDAAVETLLAAYERLDREQPVRPLRMAVTHSNFMTAEAVAKAARLGVVLDIQPAWLYLDARTLVQQFGYERLRYFQPLRSFLAAGGIAGGGSDHMQKIGARRSINPYHPFLGMWVTVTRSARWYEDRLHPGEAITREQAIRFYTRNNAYLLFWEKEIGSLEPGKRADFIVIDRDLLTCPVDAIRETQVLETWLDGRRIYQRDAASS